MEIFRRLGLAQKLRDTGLPADYPNDCSYRTTATGIELSRILIPCRRDRYTASERTGYRLADGRAAAPHQPDLHGTRAVRARRCHRRASDPEPHRVRRISAKAMTASLRPSANLDSGTDLADSRRFHRRLRRRAFAGPQGDRRQPAGHADHPARAIDLYPRPHPARPDGPAGLDDAVAQSAALRHGGRDRRPRQMADPQPPQSRRRDFRVGRSRLPRSAPSSASAPISSTRSSARKTGSAAALSPTASARAARSSAATPRICGCPMPATA